MAFLGYDFGVRASPNICVEDAERNKREMSSRATLSREINKRQFTHFVSIGVMGFPTDLTEEELEYWQSHTEELHQGLDALCHRRIFTEPQPTIASKRGQLITLGMRKSARGLHGDLLSKNIDVDKNACAMLDAMNYHAGPPNREVEAVTVSNATLKCPEICTFDQARKAGEKFGLYPCPPDLGPEYLLQDKRLDVFKQRTIMMDPIEISYGHIWIFQLERDEERRYLFGRTMRDKFGPKTRWVFIRPRSG